MAACHRGQPSDSRRRGDGALEFPCDGATRWPAPNLTLLGWLRIENWPNGQYSCDYPTPRFAYVRMVICSALTASYAA